MARQSQIYNFGIRISCPKFKDRSFAEGMQPEVLDYLKGIDANKYVFQLEDSYKEMSFEEKMALTVNKEWHPPLRPIMHNLHFQINANLGTKQRASQLLKTTIEWFPGHSVHVAPASVKGKAALRNYCMKDDTRVAGPWADTNLYLGEDLLTLDQFTPQQKDLHDFLQGADPNNFKRAALWIYCPHGGSGKTELAKYCYYKYGWPMFSYGKAGDILYVVSKFQNEKCYMFNLSKTKQADVSEQELYAALEGVKDGMFLSTKYESCMVAMRRSHVVVFANHLPKMGNMTQARFNVMKWTPLPKHMITDDYSGYSIAEKFLSPEELAAEIKAEREREAVLNPDTPQYEFEVDFGDLSVSDRPRKKQKRRRSICCETNI